MMLIKKRLYPVLLTLFITMLIILLNKQENNASSSSSSITKSRNANNDFLVWNYSLEDNLNGKWRHLTATQVDSLSKLGRILYLNEDYPNIDVKKNYVILLWKYGKALVNRHIKHWTNNEYDPFEKCSVNNCQLTYNDTDINVADLVLFHMQRIKGPNDLPTNITRNLKQYWTFLTDESPYHMFLSYNGNLNNFNNLFNWSMTYSMRSDIPVPYGRATELNKSKTIKMEDFNKWKDGKDTRVLAAIMGSNCGGRNHRWNYVKELQKYMDVDIYGGCGKLKCPGHFGTDCETLSKYLFYLAFENSNCPEYLTEKLWWNAYSKESIPIIMGSSKDTVMQILPPHSYIHVEEFASPRDLANYLLYLNTTPSELYTYYQWKGYFQIHNEHGYFKTDSYHYCRVCEALNYNEKTVKIYDNLETFWNRNQCFSSWDDK